MLFCKIFNILDFLLLIDSIRQETDDIIFSIDKFGEYIIIITL